MEWVSINDITPASYNPRYLSDLAMENLKGSLTDLGFILPIIVNRTNQTIIAGHQRTKTASTLGISLFPAYYVDKEISITDEIKFNQLHNGTEGEPDNHSTLKRQFPEGFYDEVPLSTINRGGCVPVFSSDIASLIMRYGNVFCAIACGNEIVLGNSYIVACFSLNIGVNISVISADKRPLFDKWFAKQYGVFNYDKIDKCDYVQGLAQPSRHAEMKCSVLYRELVIPYIQTQPRTLRILDFGCGKGLSLGHIRTSLGFSNAIGVEFFNHNKVGIDIQRGQRMINRLFSDVKRHGPFDVVIADAVINSVSCKQAENAVWAILNLLVKPNGIIFFSGRLREAIESVRNMQRDRSYNNTYLFFDKDGFTGFLKEGQWFFQLFHYREQIDNICQCYGWEVLSAKNTNYYFRAVRKTRELTPQQYREAILYEFNLKLPNGQSYNRHLEALTVFDIN